MKPTLANACDEELRVGSGQNCIASPIQQCATLQNNGTFVSSTASWDSPLSMAPISQVEQNSTSGRPMLLWEATPSWNRLSSSDKSVVRLARVTDNSIVGVTDKDIYNQCAVEGISSIRPSAFLADMVLGNIFSYQKGTAIFRFWKNHDPRWVSPPRLCSGLGELLEQRRQKIKNGDHWLFK